MPRRLIAVMAYSAVPGFPIETVPAIRSGSCAPNMPANGPSVPGGSAGVSSRAWSTSVSSCSSTRSEAYILRRFQSIPPPISDAISFGVRTTESGPAEVRRLLTLAFPEATAVGVGAPTAVSATGGRAVERPNQCAPVCMIGSRNHHTSASAPITRIAHPSLMTPLRQPAMASDRIHRAIGLERTLHQVDLRHGDRRIEIGACEHLFESLEIARSRIARGAPQGHVRPKRPRFRGKAQRRERLLDTTLQQLEARIRCHARPHHPGAVVVGKDAEAADLQRHWARLMVRTGCTLQRRHELRLP